MDAPQTILHAMLWSLAEPVVVAPALLFGWFVRRRWVMVTIALVIGVMWLSATFGDDLADGPSLPQWVGALAVPLLLAFVARRLRQAYGPSYAPANGPGAQLVAALFGAFLGGIVGAAIGFGLGMIYFSTVAQSTYRSEEGMVVIFLFMMPALVIGGLAGCVAGFLRARRRGGVGMSDIGINIAPWPFLAAGGFAVILAGLLLWWAYSTSGWVCWLAGGLGLAAVGAALGLGTLAMLLAGWV